MGVLIAIVRFGTVQPIEDTSIPCLSLTADRLDRNR
jgi:hypothetical protein